ncbi:hypothetical protein L1887_19677 [Cichorium endivia]|nr:hypothetical protein L1887_19677 [Cichorium endivia]
MASKRILKELKDLPKDPPTSCSKMYIIEGLSLLISVLHLSSVKALMVCCEKLFLLNCHDVSRNSSIKVLDSNIFAFWTKISIDVDSRNVRLKSNSYTTTNILGMVVAANIQKEMPHFNAIHTHEACFYFDKGSGPLHPLVVSLATRLSGCVAAAASHSFETVSVCVAKGKYVGLGWFEHGDGGVLMPWGEMSKSMPKVLFARVQRYSQLHYNKLEKRMVEISDWAFGELIGFETSDESKQRNQKKMLEVVRVTPNGVGTLLCAVGKEQGNQAWEQEQELQDTKEDMEMQ